MERRKVVSAICAEVSSFTQLHIGSSVTTVNVHSNSIKDFSGLEQARDLEELDASSNEIESFSGLQRFASLRILNLASNQIHDVHGLHQLTNLRYLNISYNAISILDGFTELAGPGYAIQTIELHGNCISDLHQVITNFVGLSSLRHLILSRDEKHSNPVCMMQHYRKEVLQRLPQLASLDSKDRSGQPVSSKLGNFLDSISLDLNFGTTDYSSTNPTSPTLLSSPERVGKMMKTPNIDAVLHSAKASELKFKGSQQSVNSVVESVMSSIEEESIEDKHLSVSKSELQSDQEVRLKYLEAQLASLVAAREETEKSGQAMKQKPKTGRPVKPVHGAKLRAPLQNVGNRGKTVDHRSKSEKAQRPGIQEKETYMNLVKELEVERERRWKSEQAARKLAEIIRNLNHEKAEGISLQGMAAETAEKLKKAVIREQEKTDKVRCELVESKEMLATLSDELANCKRIIEEQKHMLEKAESGTAEAIATNTRVISEQAKRLHESEMRASGALREIEAQKSQNSKLEKRIIEIQELLCKTKRDHESEKQNMFSINNVEFRNALSREINKQETSHREDIKTLKATIATLKSQYTDLEDEFRQALHIEAERFATVNSQNITSMKELDKLKSLYQRCKVKEEKCQSIITDLTSVAKEQKLKITELINGKKEMSRHFEDTVSKLEVAAESGRRSGVQLELVKQEKSRLLSQLAALQTVVDGLRDERKLWGHELAQQGASLAQDRGRLDSRIEALQQEVTSLKKQNERDLDTLRIKSKIVEDQTETIHRMKQALVDKDQEVVRIQEESMDRQKRFDQDIEDLTQDNAALNEQITALLDRKKELKENVADSERELEELKQSHSRLVKKWSEKGQVLSQLEKQVKQMKETCDKKTQSAMKERDDALESKTLLTARLAKADSAFREQLEAANAAHQEEMDRVMKNCGNEVEIMKRKICSVEEEMREVLRDAERQKKAMEVKFQRATSVFKDLQDGFKFN